jgi:hypothetical protein
MNIEDIEKHHKAATKNPKRYVVYLAVAIAIFLISAFAYNYIGELARRAAASTEHDTGSTASTITQSNNNHSRTPISVNSRSTSILRKNPDGTETLISVAGGSGDGGISIGGDGGDSYIAGNGIVYGAEGGSTEPGGIGGKGGRSFIGGTGIIYGGKGGNAGTTSSVNRAPTPKDLGLPEQFWGAGQPDHDGLAVISWGDEGNTSAPKGTVVFTASNSYSYPGVLFQPKTNSPADKGGE